VSWADARDFCAWAGQLAGRKLALPTEAQWEKAARGAGGNVYPWGDHAPDSTYANFDRALNETAPVDRYGRQGDSPYGAADMAGNASEWTSTLYDWYPYQAGDGREKTDAQGERVVRGGSYANPAQNIRTAARVKFNPDNRDAEVGFRVVVNLR
jgi:toxoflavin biosynthesis protein ToxD